uniref:Protein kinase domain-containing protein n=1 Tax=Acrobeloides nanus TaxID=290746 RepID=A0A914CTI1_9BILA
MEYLNRFKSTVSSLHKQIATAGPGLSWKIYSGIKYTTKQAVAIWVFEKKQVERWPKHERETFPEILKKGISQLTRLRHPRLLIVEHALEESRDSYAFCTEPIFASLANVFGNTENISPSPEHLKDFKLVDIEIRHGLFQLGEALSFLHLANMLHGNLCPSSIIINDKGNWKLAGFDFCITGTSTPNGKATFEATEWDRRVLSIMNPELDYSAPELVTAVKVDVYADMYSIGVLAFSVFNDYKPIFENKNMLDNFNKNIDKLKQLPLNLFAKIPDIFRDDVKACLNINYFDDPLIKTLNFLDSLMQMDNTQKMQFFKGLPQLLEKFTKRPLLQKVLPYLTAEFSTPELIPFILPSIFLIAEQATSNEFSEVIFPPLIPVFAMNRPYQIVLTMLQKMPLLLQKTPEGDIRRYVLPLVYGAISNDNMKIQELCLAIIPTIGKLVDRDAMRSQLLPKLLKLSLEGTVLS